MRLQVRCVELTACSGESLGISWHLQLVLISHFSFIFFLFSSILPLSSPPYPPPSPGWVTISGLLYISPFGLISAFCLPSTSTLVRSCCSLGTIEPWGSSVYSNRCSLVGGSVLFSSHCDFRDLFFFRSEREKIRKSNDSTAVVLHHRWTNLHFAASTRPSPTLPSPPWAALSSIFLSLGLLPAPCFLIFYLFHLSQSILTPCWVGC